MTGFFTIQSLADQSCSTGRGRDAGEECRDPAAELAALHITVWRETYAGMLAQSYLDGMQLAPRAERWRDWIRLARQQDGAPRGQGEPLSRLRIARHLPSGRIAGFCRVGPARDDGPPLPQELIALNVLAEFHGTGVARQLVDATLGERSAYLWVVRQNARAIAFYRKLGFAADGVSKRDDTLQCDEIRMVRR